MEHLETTIAVDFYRLACFFLCPLPSQQFFSSRSRHTRLQGDWSSDVCSSDLIASPDIRAGMAMLLAALCAQGTSTIGNVGEIDRGYERIDERLRSLGARIERIEG